MGLPTPNITKYHNPGRFSRLWNALPIIRGPKILRISGTILIVFMWIIYFMSGDAESMSERPGWLQSIEKPARKAGVAIVDLVTSRPSNGTTIRYGSSKNDQHETYEFVDKVDKVEKAPLKEVKPEKVSPVKAVTSSTSAVQLTTTTPTKDVEATPPPPPPPPMPPTWPERLPDPAPKPLRAHKRLLTLATMVKNQRRWLREWIEFNLMMGVEHFIIYDNDSTDQSLEVLQHYIDEGIVTFISWPPKEVPPPGVSTTVMEEWQDSWFRDTLETCLHNDWKIHKQGPCQLAAFSDAIRRTKGGVSRWLGIWDVDEFIFPREKSKYNDLATLLREEYANTRHIRIWGNVFGTSGHVKAAYRKQGSPLQALLTEEYIYRAELDHHDEYPFAKVNADGWEVYGKGKLKYVRFGGADMYARKSMADPDMVSHSFVHHFEAPGNSGPEWTEVKIDVTDDTWKMNHYAYQSQEDARRKSQANKNPFMDFNEEIDAFFSREKDTEVHYLLPKLKERMLKVIQEHPPAHPDDWQPGHPGHMESPYQK